ATASWSARYTSPCSSMVVPAMSRATSSITFPPRPRRRAGAAAMLPGPDAARCRRRRLTWPWPGCTVCAVLPDRADLVVVGAAIVGLGHAYEAHRRGLTVAVIDRDARPVGASVQNFGHCGVTAQSGEARRLALETRERWLRLGSLAGFWVTDAGAVVAARADDELA